MIIDEVAAPAEADALAEFREQVRQEQAEKSVRQKMSEPALTKLRAIREQDKQQETNDAKFAAALKLVVVNGANLQRLIDRCNKSVSVKQIDRKAAKLGWWIRAGYRLGEEIDSVTMLNFFSGLTGDEIAMSDSRFANAWDSESAEKLKASRVRRDILKVEDTSERLVPEPVEGVDFVVTRDLNGGVLDIEYTTAADESVWTGIPKPKEPEIRRCKAGRKCLKFANRRAGVAAGKGDYCSRNCSESVKAREKRAQRLSEAISMDATASSAV